MLVNEAAGLSVDDALLARAQCLTVLASGCACCTGLPALIAALRGLADRRSRGENIADLVLETSGLADPAAIIHALATDPVLTHHIRPNGVTVLVDAQHGLTRSIPALALAQMRAADHLILTKPDAVPPHHLATAAATLHAINPLAMVTAASHGVPVALPDLPATARALATDDQPMLACTLPLPPDADWAALSLWLSGLLHHHSDRLLRIKGVIRSPAGRLLIQTERNSVQPPEILPPGIGTDNQLAIIGQGFDPLRLQSSLTGFLSP